MTSKEIYQSIDQSKISPKGKDFLQKAEKSTKGFTIQNDKLDSVMKKLYSDLKAKKPEALKDVKTKTVEKEVKVPTTKTEQKKDPKKKTKTVKKKVKKATGKKKVTKPTKTPSTPKEGKVEHISTRAKKLAEKEGITFKEARARLSKEAKEQLKKDEKQADKELDKLLKFVRKDSFEDGEKYPKIYGKQDPKKASLSNDAKRMAKPVGKRISKNGKTYYEYRDNRSDRNSLPTKEGYKYKGEAPPYLEAGGTLPTPFGQAGLVGETGAMNEVDLFAMGGDLPQGVHQYYANTYNPAYPTPHGYAKGGYLEGKTYYIVNYYSSVSDIPNGIALKNKSFGTKEDANTFLKSIESKGGRGFVTDFKKPTRDEISKLDRDRNENYMMAKGGEIDTSKKGVYVMELKDGTFKVSVNQGNKDFPREFNDVFPTKERVMKFANKLAKNNKTKVVEIKYAKGGKMMQGYNDRLDESLGNRNSVEPLMMQSYKDRRDESKGMEKSMGRRAYQSVGTMDKMAKGGEIDAFIMKFVKDAPASNLRVDAEELTAKLKKGGKLGFDGLAKKVAKRYEGKPVEKQFQNEYGKTYSKEEAMEVGRKVAGKVYRQQQAMAKGGATKQGYDYVPQEAIDELSYTMGKVSKSVSGSNVLSGAYVKSGAKAKTKSKGANDLTKRLLAMTDDEDKTKVILEKDVKEMQKYVSDKLIIAFYLGLPKAYDFKGDFSYGGGIISYRLDAVKKTVSETIKNLKASKFEMGLKYPSYDFEKLLGKPLEIKDIKGKKQKWMNDEIREYAYKIWVWKDCVIGDMVGVYEDGKYKDYTYGSEATLNGGYKSVQTSKASKLESIIEFMAKDKNGFVKDNNVLYNGLGGATFEALDKNKIKYEAGGTLPTPFGQAGLVGETGAMNEMDMFAMGGGLPQGVHQYYANTYNPAYPTPHGYAKGGKVNLEKLSDETYRMGEIDKKHSKKLFEISDDLADLELGNKTYAKGGMIQYYETEEDRDFGDSQTFFGMANDTEGMIDEARRLYKREGYEAVEVVDENGDSIIVFDSDSPQGERFAKGGMMQGYNDRLDESLGNRDGVEPMMMQSYKDRRDESKGMEKAMGRRAYQSVGTMDKMAKGGKTQGYNDKLDESLGNTKGKRSTKEQNYKDRRNESEAMEKKGGKRKYARVKTMDKGNRKKRKTPMSLAKEIRKEGEKWQDAVKRASAMLKKK